MGPCGAGTFGGRRGRDGPRLIMTAADPPTTGNAAGVSTLPVDPGVGLRESQVLAQVAAGLANGAPPTTGRTLRQILRANVLTRFNAILGSLFVVVLFVGPIQDGLFGIVLVVNTAIGVVQELRSKRALDALAILNAPTSRVVRSGRVVDIPFERIVLGDVVEVQRGDQVPVDGRLLVAEGLEADESLLTGESEPMAKSVHDPVMSGSVIVAGMGRFVATGVGESSYARDLEAGARRFSLIRSELQQGTNEILRLVTWVMVPTGVALFVTQLLRSHQPSADALRASVAGVAAMVPEGLVLLTSMAFAAGALRLARRRVLVQELAAVEGLARVDVLCIDKTGTLTEAGLQLLDVEPTADLDRPEAEEVLSQLAGADRAPNPTMHALREELAGRAATAWAVREVVAFSSARKWSAVAFAGHGSWILGAPQVVLVAPAAALAARVELHEHAARRVLVLARTGAAFEGTTLPTDVEPVALVVLAERVREDAGETVKFLLEQGMTIKVLSGDAAGTVTQVASRLGIPSPGPARDVSRLDSGALHQAVDSTNLLCRVRPEQKVDVVEALQRGGHVVAMVGDGVNDVQALKRADLGIAMGSGSPSSRSVARVVLLDSSFSSVPRILAEERRVIANIERVAKLFVTKTVYAALLAVAVVVTSVPYPFFPRHLTIVSTLTIGVPGFFLAFAAGAPRATPGFTRRVLRFTVPAGLIAAGATFASYLVARAEPGTTLAEARTAALLGVFGLAVGVLVLVCRPLNAVRVVMIVVMGGSFVLLFAVGLSRRVFALDVPGTAVLAQVAGIVAVSVLLLWAWAWADGRGRVADGPTGPVPPLSEEVPP